MRKLFFFFSQYRPGGDTLGNTFFQIRCTWSCVHKLSKVKKKIPLTASLDLYLQAKEVLFFFSMNEPEKGTYANSGTSWSSWLSSLFVCEVFSITSFKVSVLCSCFRAQTAQTQENKRMHLLLVARELLANRLVANNEHLDFSLNRFCNLVETNLDLIFCCFGQTEINTNQRLVSKKGNCGAASWRSETIEFGILQVGRGEISTVKRKRSWRFER